MTHPHRPGQKAPSAQQTGLAPAPWTVRPAGTGLNLDRPMRRYEILALDRAGQVVDEIRAVPAHPVFDSAFTALARGTLLMTEAGPMAVEDLMPGIRVETRDSGMRPLMWRGATVIQPKVIEGAPAACLYRIPMDAFGPQRPSPDLVLGPSARLVHRGAALTEIVGSDSALVPLQVFEDGFNVIRVTPASPVRVFHIGFARHHIVAVNGLEIETVHPGPETLARIGTEAARLYVSLFPHLESLSAFGPLALPRLSREAASALHDAA